MPVTVIIGGQYGSEGKGKTAKYFAEKQKATSIVRVGGINSGHSIQNKENEEKLIFQVLPAAVFESDANCILPAGSYIDIDLLFKEMALAKIDKSKVKIHPNAGIILENSKKEEIDSDLRKRIASTETGTGASVSHRVMRDSLFVKASDVPELSEFIVDTTEFMRDELRKNHTIVIEGTQGYGLSNLHSPYFPFATSRDTTAAGFISEAGLSPFDVKNIVMAIRSYPIRVGGNSGPLPNEISWDEIRPGLREFTSVTKRLRRVGMFDPSIVKMAIQCNHPNLIVMNHLDYIQGNECQQKFLDDVETAIDHAISYVGFNPLTLELRSYEKK